MEDRVRDLISKLLALSTSPNQHEAQAALMKAQELAAKYGLELDSIEDHDKAPEANEANLKDEAASPEESDIAYNLGKFFRVFVFTRRMRNGQRFLVLVGLPQDIEIFKTVHAFAVSAMNKCFQTWLKNYKKVNSHLVFDRAMSVRFKRDYIMGFNQGCKDALFKNANEKALAIIPPQAVKEYVDKNLRFGRGSAPSRKTAGSWSAQQGGYRDGHETMAHKGQKALS